MRKIRICYIVSTLKRSGPINVIKSIVKHIDKEEYEIFVISLSPEPASSLRNEFTEMGVTCINLEVLRKNIVKLVKKIKQTVKNIKPDVIHSHGIRPDILSVLFLQGKYKCCSTIHNYAPMDYKMKYGSLIGTIASHLHLKTIGNMDHPISCSQSIADMLRGHGLKVDAIQNGVDTDYFKPDDIIKHKEELRRKLNIPTNKKVIISVGYLSVRKDPITIIKAFSKSNLIKNFCLLFLGDGPQYSIIENIVKKFSLPCIFAGHVSNVITYLQSSDYFISASKSEGLPNTVLEAGAVGLPLILSDIPPHKEVLSKNMDAGYFFTTGNISSLTSVLNNLQTIEPKRYQEMSESARRLIVDSFSAASMSKKYQDFYKWMLKNE